MMKRPRASRRRSLILTASLACLFAATSRTSLSNTPSPTPTPLPYAVAPSGGTQGKDYEVMVSKADCLPGQKPFDGFTLYAPQGSGLSVAEAKPSGCHLTARVTVLPDAPTGPAQLWLRQGAYTTPVTFNVSGITAGPKPPGLAGTQVDVMWSVLPPSVVGDNFGRKIKERYYGIEVVIGNNTGYDLQVASVGFTVPKLTDEAGGYTVPSTGYRVARGSLQRRQELNPRNLILNGLQVIGPILTGLTSFFPNIGSRTNYLEAANVISNPLEKGLRFALPDLTVAQLDRLADQTFRDDIPARTFIPNNTQIRILTFVPKEFLRPLRGGNETDGA